MVYDSIYKAHHKADSKVVLTLDKDAQRYFDMVDLTIRMKLNSCWNNNIAYDGNLNKKVRLILRIAAVLHTLHPKLPADKTWRNVRGVLR